MSRNKVDYGTILAAKNGDQEAMDTILSYFSRYIKYYSLRECVDSRGNIHLAVNQDIYDRIQRKIICILVERFDPTKLPEGETLEI